MRRFRISINFSHLFETSRLIFHTISFTTAHIVLLKNNIYLFNSIIYVSDNSIFLTSVFSIIFNSVLLVNC